MILHSLRLLGDEQRDCYPYLQFSSSLAYESKYLMIVTYSSLSIVLDSLLFSGPVIWCFAVDFESILGSGTLCLFTREPTATCATPDPFPEETFLFRDVAVVDCSAIEFVGAGDVDDSAVGNALSTRVAAWRAAALVNLEDMSKRLV